MPIRWGAPRIHGELLKLGIDIGHTSVAKYMASVEARRPKVGKHFSIIMPTASRRWICSSSRQSLLFALRLADHGGMAGGRFFNFTRTIFFVHHPRFIARVFFSSCHLLGAECLMQEGLEEVVGLAVRFDMRPTELPKTIYEVQKSFLLVNWWQRNWKLR